MVHQVKLPKIYRTSISRAWLRPPSASKVRSFLGLVFFCRRFIKNFRPAAVRLKNYTERQEKKSNITLRAIMKEMDGIFESLDLY